MKKRSTTPKSPKQANTCKGGPITIGLDLGDKTSRHGVLGDNGEVMSEGSVATTRKAMAEKFCEDAAMPGGDGSGNPFAVVEPMAEQSGLWPTRGKCN